MITTNGYIVGDGSWELKIYVTDLQVERVLRVKGDLHVGGVMFRLVEDLDVAVDWSDHALWWPQKNTWLSRTRSTLDQYGVQADAILFFTPMHKTLRVQLPDLRMIDARVDFSVKCFSAVVALCKDLGLRHPEELSFCRPLSNEHLKKNYRSVGVSPRQRSQNHMGPITPQHDHHHVGYISSPDGKSTPGLEHDRSPTPTWRNGSSRNGSHPPNGHSTPNNMYTNGHTPDSSYLNDSSGQLGSPLPNLAVSPPAPTLDVKSAQLRPKSLVERARINSGWLDSSLSLYEQVRIILDSGRWFFRFTKQMLLFCLLHSAF